MQFRNRWIGLASVVSLALFFTGCESAATPYKSPKDLKKEGKLGAVEHDHGHSEPGPHKGSVVEIGNDEFHAEIVIDHDSHSIRVYLLGPDAKTAVTSTDPELTLTVAKDKQVKLKAAPQPGETDGKTSAFEILDDELVHSLLDAGFIHGSMELTIGGKKFTPELDVHFAGGHDHDHHDEVEKKPAATPSAG